MTRTTIFLYHPHLDQSTVNLRLAQAAEGLEGVQIRDMYSIYPDFEIDVDFEQNLLEETDRIILQFPMYWYSCPPLLKKWEDDVLTHGWAYGSTGTALHGKELALAVSTGARASDYSRDSALHYTITDLLRPFQAVSNLIGTRFTAPFVTSGTLGMGDDELEKSASAYAAWLGSDLPELGAFE